jgi:polyhydroxyalkanoate synthase
MATSIEELAERRGGIALTSALGIDRKEILSSLEAVIEGATKQPRVLLEVGGHLLQDLTAIAFGSSDIAPPPKDARFKDPAWQESPVFRRVGQSYLAWAHALNEWLDHSGLEGINRERARFILDIAKDLAAPMNGLAGNPEALRRLWETRGRSLIDGVRNFVDDVRHNHGYPAVADRHAFKVGTDVAATPGQVVYRNDLLEVIQYQPTTPDVHKVPLLYVFSQVNRFYLGDLTPDRSLFRQLLDAGIQVFAVSWRNPTEEQRDWGLDTYADGVIRALEVVRTVTGTPQVNLIGVCAGGLVTACAAGVLAARGDDRLKSLSLFINILDNRPADSDFGLFVTERSVNARKTEIRNAGVFDEKNVFEMFAWLRPEENVMAFFRSNYLLGEAPLKHPLLFWSMDYTRLPAGLYADFLDLSVKNSLAKGELRLLGQRIDLKKFTRDTYLMAGSTDHITPWRGCYRSTQLFGGHIEFVLTNQNHTQTISARGDNKHLRYWRADELPESPDAWTRAAHETRGDWREHWFKWLAERSEERVPAPVALGCEAYPVLYPAPGKYVVES